MEHFPCFIGNVGGSGSHLEFVLPCENTVLKTTEAAMEFGASALPTVTMNPQGREHRGNTEQLASCGI